MSRSGLVDDMDDVLAYGRWRGMVKSSLKGKRGQKLLRDIADALDAMPVKELIANELESDGEFCTLGVVGCARGIDMSDIDPEDSEQVSEAFDIADCLAREVVYMNDECGPWGDYKTVEICGPMPNPWSHHRRQVFVEHENQKAERWKYMRNWVEKHLNPQPTAAE
jgi:hypothetical protein